jgi:hypothetical protein
MPRRRVDKVIEHRISLSDFERAQLKESIDTAQAAVAVRGVTNTIGAIATGLGGAGGFLFALAFAAWKAPTLWVDFTNKFTNPLLDDIVDTILPGTPVEHRRYAQDLAKRRGDLAKEEAAYCSFNSGLYNEARCSQTQLAKDKYFEDLAAFRKMLIETYTAGEREIIYYGLGDINPNFAN